MQGFHNLNLVLFEKKEKKKKVNWDSSFSQCDYTVKLGTTKTRGFSSMIFEASFAFEIILSAVKC